MNCEKVINQKAKQLLLAVSIQMLALAVTGQAKMISFNIYPERTVQTIENFGGSGCWFSEGIGKYWDHDKKDSIAKLLFSKEFDNNGKPVGIGLSAWRFNIGGGTAEQGDKSGIKTAVKRVECFMDENGNYDWSKQEGYQWFLRKAHDYKVENLIAFSNTPPVYFNRNGLGFKTEKDYTCNLRDDKYGAYAEFLGRVLKHFDSSGIHFKFISPVNEPQWDWSNKFGEMNQEGTPWHNKDIFRITATLDSVLQKNKLKTQILLPEAATLKHLYTEGGHAGKQIQFFLGGTSPYSIKKIPSVYPVLAGHSYFTDAGDSNRVQIRRKVRDTMNAYKSRFWQSEYSMLGNGYKENKQGKIPAMDCALFLAKMVHTDLTVANAAAWQLWNVYEPGSADFDTRYYLIALQTNDSNNRGSFKVTKNLWAMGHYSRFIRPGMQRLVLERDDHLTDEQSSGNVMCSAFSDGKGKTVIILINYTNETRTVNCNIKGARKYRSHTIYTTTAEPEVNMKPGPIADPGQINLRPRSINTIVLSE
jgi:O-glycosyl hydrolase